MTKRGAYPSVPRHEICIGDEDYPTPLYDLDRPPEVLYVLGTLPKERECVAVVGARKATPYGLYCASQFATSLAETGHVIVSGGAMGCDQAAHRAALAAQTPTIAVMGCGADMIYPASASQILSDIASCGAIISEHEWGVEPRRWMFRERNRLIAGLSRATLIVEAGMPSGTFSTADYALDLGRDVFAVPGSILSSNSRGSNWLITQGASPIIDHESLCNALNLLDMGARPATLTGLERAEEDPLLAAIIAAPSRVDSLSEDLSIPLSQLMERLAELEILGLIVKQFDGHYGPNPLIK